MSSLTNRLGASADVGQASTSSGVSSPLRSAFTTVNGRGTALLPASASEATHSNTASVMRLWEASIY